MPRFTVVIPVRNERASIQPLFDKFEAALDDVEESYRILVVDGFSSDGTVESVQRYANGCPLKIIELSENLGLGGALNIGLRTAVEDSDFIVTMDGDDSHDPALIPDMLRALEDGHDMVIASRFEEGGQEVGVAGHRRLMSHAASHILRTVFPMEHVKDYSSGFRAYRSTALREVENRYGELVEERGFSCQLELLLKLRTVDASATEVPLVLRYDQKRTPSKMNVPHTMARYLALTLRHIGRNGASRSELAGE